MRRKRKKTNIAQIKKVLKNLKPILRRKFKVKEIGVFGSYARGEEKRSSDVDILVEFYETPGFFDFIELEEFLTEKLGVKVDLVTKSALKPPIKDLILRETITI